MTYIANNTSTVTGVLAADVANTGTFTVSYPSGTSQNTFNTGLTSLADSYIVINGNDRWTVSASQVSFTFGASNITVTNNSGVTWPAGSTFRLNLDRQDIDAVHVITYPINLAAIAANGDVLTDMRPGINGIIEYAEFVVNERATTAAKAATLNLEINTTDVTGGVMALTTANCGTLGATVAGTSITANNRITPADTLSIEASSVTAFAEGRGFVAVRVRRVFD